VHAFEAGATGATKLFAPKSTDGLVCNGEFSAPCSALKTMNFVDNVKNVLESSIDEVTLSMTLTEISNNVHDTSDALNFEVFVFNTTSMKCVAFSGEEAFVGMTFDTILDEETQVVQKDVGLHMLENAKSNDPWMDLLLQTSFVENDGEGTIHLVYAQVATLYDSQELLIFSGYAMHPMPHISSCDFNHNGHCVVANIRSLVGEGLAEILRANTPEELGTVFNALTFGARFIEGPLSTFVFFFGNESRGEAAAYGHSWRNVRLNRTEILAANQASWLDDPEEVHQSMSELARNGGGWISFNDTHSERGKALKSACVVGVEKFGDKFYLGAALWHVGLPKKHGPNCAVCSSKTLLPCAMENSEAIVSHFEVEEMISNIDFATSIKKIQTSGDFLHEGGFHIAIYEENGTCVANSMENLHVHGTFEENYSLSSDNVFQTLLRVASQGGGWINFTITDTKMLAYVVKIAKEGRNLMAFSPIEVNSFQTYEHCTAIFNAPCAEKNANSILGQAKMDLSVATTEGRIVEIFSSITSGEDPKYTSGIDFHLIVIDDEGIIRAHGSDSKAVGRNIVRYFVTKGIATISQEFVDGLMNKAFRERGGVLDFYLNEQPMKAFVTSVTQQGQNFIVMSFFEDSPAHQECGSYVSQCPENAFCGDDEFCYCGTYFVGKFVDIEDYDDTCGTNATRHVEMKCVPNSHFDNLLAVKNLCRGAYAFNMFLVALSLFVIWKMRAHPIIRASQPKFLLLFTFGVFISSTSILFITTDDYIGVAAGPDGRNPGANLACNLTVVFYGIGFVLQYSSLFAKLRRVRVLFVNSKLKKNLVLTNAHLFRQIFFLLSIEVFIITLWVATDPLIFARERENWLPDEASCYSSSSDVWIGLLALYHFALLVYGNYTAFKARKVNGVFAETKFIAIAMLSIFEILCLSIPLIILSSSDETTQIFIRSGVVFFSDFSSLGLIFFPKFLFIINPHAVDTSGSGGNILSAQLNSKGSKGSNTRKQRAKMSHHQSTILQGSEAAVFPMQNT